MSDASQLLPCPFCGGKPEVDTEYERQGQYRSRFTIVCLHCPATMESIWENIDAKQRELQKKRLFGYWNKRQDSNATE